MNYMDLYNIIFYPVGPAAPVAPVAPAAPVDPAAPVVPLGPNYNKIKIQKSNFSFSQIQDAIFIHILMFVGFFYGYWDNSRCPVCGWWWTRPVKELRWMCSREKGEEPSGSNRNIANTPLHCTINYKTRKKGFPKLPLFLFLTFCFCVCRPYKLKGRPYILHNRKCSYSTLITLPTPTCKEKCY